jgi:type I restriction enzyme R subunit
MKPDEAAFEAAICDHLVSVGGWDLYKVGNPADPLPHFDATRGLDTAELFAFIGATQAKAWHRLLERHGGDPNSAQSRFADRLAKQLDERGTVDVLRRGVTDQGVTIQLAYFRPAHGLAPELVEQYRANRLTVTRQLPYEPDGTKTLDLAFFVNGIPVATAELKNHLTGQNIEHAIAQYRRDRDPRNVTLGRRAVVHFAVDTESVAMTTRLDGNATVFLPFNQGHNGGAGNPQNPNGHRSGYLWERVLQRDAWLDLFGRFVHVEKPATATGAPKLGGKAPGKVIFPRYHQWDAVLRLEAAARSEGPGHSYLVQHSAGSGKSNTIAWLAHRLSNLHDVHDHKVFDKVVVITDRRVLDRQLQDTVYQFEHQHGVVVQIDQNSQQLAEALTGESARIIITTLQKFPHTLDKIGSLPHRSYALIVDEAHSSQTGEAAKDLRKALGATMSGSDPATSSSAERDDDDLNPDTLEDLLAEHVAARVRQDNLSYFAFTATPKGRTLELFGRRNGGANYEPFHLYSMRQAVEEGFILDVLANYTTYKSFFELERAIEDDPELNPSKAQAAIARFIELHPAQLAQKSTVVIEHFRQHVAHQVSGDAKAMVVCSSRPHAVEFALALRRYVSELGYRIGVLAAFSGTVDIGGVSYTESSFNGFPDSQTAKELDGDAFDVIVVAEKFQTGFDQPKLYAMYVDKPLSGVNAVQTLSRLNRVRPDKSGTFVLDFRNEPDAIRAAFEPYFGKTEATPTDPNLLHDTRRRLDEYGVLLEDEIKQVVALILGMAGAADHTRIHSALGPAVDRVNGLDEETRGHFVDDLGRFVRVYGFLSQVVSFTDTALERDWRFCRALAAMLASTGGESIDLGRDIVLTALRIEEQSKGRIELSGDVGEVTAIPGAGGRVYEPEPETLSEIIDRFNEQYGTDWTDGDRLFVRSVTEDLVNEERIQLEAAANDLETFRVGFPDTYLGAIAARLDRNEKVAGNLLDDDLLREALLVQELPTIYARARVARQRVCPIGQLLGPDREDQHLEYKSTLRWDVRAESAKTGIPEKAVIKTVAGFLNSDFGGTLLVGVADDGAVIGLEPDYASFSKRGTRGDHDLWGGHLENLLTRQLGMAAAQLVSWEFASVGGHDLCRISVEPADFPVYDGRSDDDGIYWVRGQTSTRQVTDAAEIDRIVARRAARLR